MEGGADPFCRRCYPWGNEDNELIAWYSQLAKLRQTQPSLNDGGYVLKQAHSGVFAFTRGQGVEQILIAVNNSQQNITLNEPGFNYNLLTNNYTEELLINGGEAAIFARRP